MRKGLIVLFVGGILAGLYGLLQVFISYPIEEVLSFGFIAVSIVVLCLFTFVVVAKSSGGSA